jgi:ribonuclease E
MKRMLINATQEEELRMATVDGQRLYDLNIELPAGERTKANIYKGKITRIEPSLEAAFVDYGADRHGFLPLKEISSEYFVKPSESSKPNIREVLKEGQDIVVQIDKEERGNKGAALTTFVSLAGRFIVLKPNKSRSGGVSRRIVGEDRDLARKSLNDIEIPADMSVILRTAGIDRSPEELAWDLENLLTIWTAILNVVLERKSPFLIYRESNSVIRALRDYLTSDLGEILIDDEATYKEAVEFVEQVMPQNLKKLKHYVDPVPLFTRFQIESQIESAFTHSVTLPSGGSIVIDHTEALVSIDINSARATKGSDIEATALNTNLEAADEIARQLRIRDLGGLIVIDFIDMGPQKNQRAVENQLRDAVRQDRARVQIGKISRFGLLEMSRQRLRPSLGESSYLTCPRCSGIGTIRSVESLALAILRIIGEEARKERTAKVIAHLPVEVATYLLNEKRDWVQSLESRNEMQVVLVANPSLETPHYDVRRVRDDQTDLPENAGASYELKDPDAEPETPQAILERKAIEPAAIAVMKPSTQAPKTKKAKASGGLWTWLTGLFAAGSSQKKPDSRPRNRNQGNRDSRSRGGQRNRGRSDNKRSDNQNPTRKRSKKTAKKTGSRDQNRPKKDAAKQQQQQPKDEAPQKNEDAQGGENKPARSRRSRGGRRRRRGGSQDRPAQDSANDAANNVAESSGQTDKNAGGPSSQSNKNAGGSSSQSDKNVGGPSGPIDEKTAQEQFAKQQMAKESAPAKPAAQKTETESKPPRKRVPRPAKPKADDGPPKARIDAERAADSDKPSSKQEVKKESSGNTSDDAKPAEAKPVAVAKPVAAPKPAEPKADIPAPKPAEAAPKPEAKPKPESKPEPKVESAPAPKPAEPKPEPKPETKAEAAPPAPKPAEPKPAEPKPEGRLLPWDND